MFDWLYGPILAPKVDRLSTYASALAYCFVLSMVPFLAVTFALGMRLSTQFGLSDYASHYADVLNEIIPTENPNETKRIFEAIRDSYSHQGGFVTIGFLFAGYASFTLMEQIIRTLLFIYDDPRKPSEWSWRVVAKTFALLSIWMFLLLLISITAVEASYLQAASERFMYPAFVQTLLKASQIILVIGALFGTFYLTYILVPTRRYRTHLVVEGSLLASCGWVASGLLLSVLLPKLLSTSAAYLALGSIVAILLWAQACSWSVILGACWMVRFSPKTKS